MKQYLNIYNRGEQEKEANVRKIRTVQNKSGCKVNRKLKNES